MQTGAAFKKATERQLCDAGFVRVTGRLCFPRSSFGQLSLGSECYCPGLVRLAAGLGRNLPGRAVKHMTYDLGDGLAAIWEGWGKRPETG